MAEARKTAPPSIAHTYVEPVIFYEYMLAVGQVAKKADILNICHSNGYINPEAPGKLTGVLDAACIDLKAFTRQFLRDLVEGTQAGSRHSEDLAAPGVHPEIVDLLIPTPQRPAGEITAMCRWINDNLGPLTPLHFSRFYPMHKMLDLYPTPVSTLEKAYETARQGRAEIRLYRQPAGPRAESTYCHSCGKVIIAAQGFETTAVTMQDGDLRPLRHPDTRGLGEKPKQADKEGLRPDPPSLKRGWGKAGIT